MEHFNTSVFKILILLLLCYFVFMCSNIPTGFDLRDEAESIPWEKISGKIAYLHKDYNSDNSFKSGVLLVIDGNDKELIVIKQTDEPTVFSELSWSSVGTKLTYSQFDWPKGRWQLYDIDVKNGLQSNVFPSDRHNNHPAWSKDGRLAFTESWYGILVDGELFYKYNTNSTRPAWSPDSQYLVAAIGDSTSQGALYKLSLSDTSSVALLQGTGEYNQEIFYDPIYSPDGSKIAFVKTAYDLNVNGEIWLMNSDGTDPRRITSGHSDWYPAWSPEGNRIIFTRNDHLYLMMSDGSELTRLTKRKGIYPTWIP